MLSIAMEGRVTASLSGLVLAAEPWIGKLSLDSSSHYDYGQEETEEGGNGGRFHDEECR